MKNTNEIATGSLFSKLLKTTNIRRFLDRNDKVLQDKPLNKSLEALCNKKGLIPSAVIKNSNIERTYGLQIFRGIRNPSRDKILQLAFGFPLNIEETQKLLKAADKSILYPKIKRDAVMIYCLKNHLKMVDAQEILSDLKLPLLGGDTD